ncbi:MAG: divergent PAP2 family protein [Clostridia bacterium]|nr:divergent PAP2 family protein [Clostridia bacterium]NLS85885.1 divergent PAP2 family protein [Oscillospiraceae bacterium]
MSKISFFGNYILTVSLLSWLAAQVLKTIINLILSGKLDMERLYGAGGMPSAHSALVCSMFMATAKSQGVNSPMFAITFVLAAIVMYDAMGVRHETGEQAKILNIIMHDWMREEDDIENEAQTSLNSMKRLKEKVGHTPFEVLSGALLGILIAIIMPAY